MSLEVGSFINDLTAANPISTDPVGQGDDHLRLIKTCVKGTFPNFGTIFNEVRQLDVATSISSTWNSNLICSNTSATTTVVLTLPSPLSITSGFTINLFVQNAANVSVVASGGALINNAASLAVPERQFGYVTYQGANVWRAAFGPSGVGAASHFFGGALSISGNVVVGGSMSISGALALSSVSVSGAAVLNGATTLGATLSVSGIATFKSGITVSGVAILNSQVTMNSGLTVSGAFNATTIASFGGAVTMASTLSVSGAFHANTTASIGGAATLASTLSVSGAATFLGAVSISGAAILSTTLQVRGAVSADTTLSVSGAAVFGGTLSVSGAFHAKTTASIGGAVSLASTLSVSGATHLNTTLSVGGATLLGTTLTVSGAVTLQSTLSVSGAFHAKTSMSVGGATLLGGGAIINGRTSISGSVVVTGPIQTTNGQIQFPATANPSANANTLDDYEEGTWTPALTYSTPGTLVVAYGTQSGQYTKIGRVVHALMGIVTTTHTLGTATGNLIVSNLPFAPNVGPGQAPGKLAWQGITKASYTEVDWTVLNAATDTQFIASGSGQVRSNIQVGNTASGTQVTLYGNVVYNI